MNNPYEAPLSNLGVEADSAASFSELVREWEKTRLRYNGVLLAAGVIVLIIWISSLQMPAGFIILSAVPVAIGANICFFLGPLAELYLRAIFHRGAPAPSLRRTLFMLGLIGSLCVFTLVGIMPLIG
jgi:hypothetical protein